MEWAKEELSRIDLGDQRLNARSIKLLQQFAAKPTVSIPAACGGWAETIAAYRFFAQEAIEWRDILQPHMDCAVKRMGSHPVVLCLQDTTELDFNGRQAQGLGPLSYEAQRGMYVHPTYAVTPERLPLGVIDAWMWTREAKDEQGERPGILESVRWIEGYERIAERALDLPETRLVYVADREADILGLMQRADALGNPADWLIRAKHNRKLPQETDKLWDKVAKTEAVGELDFYLPPRSGRQGRQVVQQIRTLRVSFPAEKGGSFEVTAVLAKEIDPPTGEKPLEWRLLTNRVVDKLSDAAEYIDWYRCRWEIEMFFNILKNGCQVEALQLSAISRIELALALFMIITCPLCQDSCPVIFS